MTDILAVVLVFALVVIVPTMVVLVVQERVRRQAATARTVEAPRSPWATDAVLDVEALRALAEADGAEAAFVSPGHARVEAFLAEILGRRPS